VISCVIISEKANVSETFCFFIIRASSLKIEAACSSETLVSTYKFARRYNPEDLSTAVRTSDLMLVECTAVQGAWAGSPLRKAALGRRIGVQELKRVEL
jgi:hypothetical protein